MKPITFFLCVACVLMFAVASQAGEPYLKHKVGCKYGDVYYENHLNKELAKKVGTFLENHGEEIKGGIFTAPYLYRFNGRARVHLVKEGETYQTKFALLPGMDSNERIFTSFKNLNELMRNKSGPLEFLKQEIHLCDPHFNTLRIISMDE